MHTGEGKDISLAATSFYMKVIGIWSANNCVEQRFRNVALIYTILTLSFGTWITGRDVYYTWGNFSDTIYTICNFVTVHMVLFKTLVVLVHRKQFIELILYSKKNFWHSNYDCNEKMILANCRRTCTYLICIFNFFAQGTALNYSIGPIIANIGKNESDRILPFNMWLDLPMSITPYFEIIFTLQVITVYHIGLCYLCFDNFICVLNLHVASQFRILQYRLANIHKLGNEEKLSEISNKIASYRADKCHARFKNYIKQHQALLIYCTKIEEVFTVVILGQVVLFSLLMCLDGYLVLLEDATPSRRLIFTFHITGCMCQLLMFTYSCDCLMQESMQVASAVYSGPWSLLPMNKDGKLLRKDLIFVIMRSRVPSCLTASGFCVVSLETYTAVLSTAVSYFTLLRQY